MFIGERLRELRLKREITQEDLAKYCGVTAGSIGNFENGRRQASRPMILKFAKYFNVDELYFYGEQKPTDTVRELIEQLKRQGVLNEAQDVKDEVAELILNAVRMDITLNKIKKEQV
jgi:transcriptional regulator with XRE-family HTH domain